MRTPTGEASAVRQRAHEVNAHTGGVERTVARGKRITGRYHKKDVARSSRTVAGKENRVPTRGRLPCQYDWRFSARGGHPESGPYRAVCLRPAVCGSIRVANLFFANDLFATSLGQGAGMSGVNTGGHGRRPAVHPKVDTGRGNLVYPLGGGSRDKRRRTSTRARSPARVGTTAAWSIGSAPRPEPTLGRSAAAPLGQPRLSDRRLCRRVPDALESGP